MRNMVWSVDSRLEICIRYVSDIMYYLQKQATLLWAKLIYLIIQNQWKEISVGYKQEFRITSLAWVYIKE